MPVIRCAVPDVFDPAGRYLGRMALPFALTAWPRPLFRTGWVYGVVRDERDVPFVVSARIRRPGGD